MFKKSIFSILLAAAVLSGCGKGQKTAGDVLDSNAAKKVYVAPGQKDAFYWFMLLRQPQIYAFKFVCSKSSFTAVFANFFRLFTQRWPGCFQVNEHRPDC